LAFNNDEREFDVNGQRRAHDATKLVYRSFFFSFIKCHDKYNIKKAYVSVIGNTHIPQIDMC